MTVKCPSCRNRYWHDRKCTACGWIWNPQGLEPTGQTGAPLGIEALTGVQDTEMVVPKAKPPKQVGATLDSALARQVRAKKNLALVEVQLTTVQQKMEEARAEMASSDKAVNEARQLAVQDTVIFADDEVLEKALRMLPQQQTLDSAAREALARMTDAPTSMRAMQQMQQQGPTPKAVLREAVRQAENTAVGESPQDPTTQQTSCGKDWRTTLARSGRRSTRSSGADPSRRSTTDLLPTEGRESAGGRSRQTEDNCKQRPDSSEAPNLLPPTEATADAIEQLYQTGGEAQKRTDGAFEDTTHSLKSDVRQKRCAHAHPRRETMSATATSQPCWYHRTACRYSRNGYNCGRTRGFTLPSQSPGCRPR